MKLQLCNGLMGPVRVFDLVQLCLGEDAVEVLDGHLIEGDHVLKFSQLKTHKAEKKFLNTITRSWCSWANKPTTVSPLLHTEQCGPWILQCRLVHFCSVGEEWIMNLKEQKEEEIWDAAPSVLNVNLCLNNFVTFGKFFAHLQFLLLKYVHMVWLPILLSSLQFPDKNVLTFKLNMQIH